MRVPALLAGQLVTARYHWYANPNYGSDVSDRADSCEVKGEEALTLQECELAAAAKGSAFNPPGTWQGSRWRPRGCYGDDSDIHYNAEVSGDAREWYCSSPGCGFFCKTSVTCKGHLCGTALIEKPSLASIHCASDMCSDGDCCVKAEVTCSRYSCGAGWIEKAGLESIQCASDVCADSDCCSQSPARPAAASVRFLAGLPPSNTTRAGTNGTTAPSLFIKDQFSMTVSENEQLRHWKLKFRRRSLGTGHHGDRQFIVVVFLMCFMLTTYQQVQNRNQCVCYRHQHVLIRQ
eukprot:TRINITY_DN51386_c0_g1_i1.p1 TRINITY_DN51386_c0_g1~~TRINITY_DN51386_c0_g1_i1.p1  ORF type:complete len:291 (-),score=28.25 TRINITY_DN51386_c0_g1_i1:166-1038(-)